MTKNCFEEDLKDFKLLLIVHQYSFPVKEDLVPGKELLMIKVEDAVRNNTLNPSIFSTKIKIDLVKDDVVYYKCVVPYWEHQCFVPVSEFLRRDYVDESYGNDIRYAVDCRPQKVK